MPADASVKCAAVVGGRSQVAWWASEARIEASGNSQQSIAPRFHIEALAYVVGRLKAVKEGGRSLLDSCMIAYGSGNSDGNRHNHDNLPTLLIGQGGGTVKTGRHVTYARNTPIANLWIEMMERMGVKVDKFGDSNGRLTGLNG